MRTLKLDSKLSADGRLTKIANEKIIEFMRSNSGALVEINMAVIDKPEQYLHKWYRGTILPDIAFALGDNDVSRVHWKLKSEYLYKDCTDVNTIPDKHFSKGYYAITSDCMFNGESVLYRYASGVCLVVNHDKTLRGYIPSTGLITHSEMEDFTLRCEQRLLHDLNSFIGCSKQSRLSAADFQKYQVDIMTIRDNAIKKNPELFDE